MRDDREKLFDIQEAIEQIEKYAREGLNVFAKDELRQVWVLHYLEIIGEASRALSSDFKVKHPELPWSKMIGMRNILVHHYFEIDLTLIWFVVQNDLPELKRLIQAIIEET